MKRILATGTFDILHPGHIYFLKKARSYGDELHVIITRDCNVTHKPKPIINEYQRKFMVSKLKYVDYVYLGDKKDYFTPVLKIQPDIIALGFDQNFDELQLRKKLNYLGLQDIKIIRINQKKSNLYSSHLIIKKILFERINQNKNNSC